jgi:hypothetical protein
MQPSEVWNTLREAAHRFVDDLDGTKRAIDPGRVAKAVVAAHEHLPDVDVYRDLLEREILEYVTTRRLGRM